MKKLIFALFASFLMVGWSYAQVENNEAVVDQSGFMNDSEVLQIGRNYAEVSQEGFMNYSDVFQEGINKGNGKWGVFVDQYGGRNSAEAIQFGEGPGNKAVQIQNKVKLNSQFVYQEGNMNKSKQRQLGKGENWETWYKTRFNMQEVLQFGEKNVANQLQKYGLVMTSQLIEQWGEKNKASQKMMGDPNDWPEMNFTRQEIFQEGEGNKASQLMKKNVDGFFGSGFQSIYTSGLDNEAEQVMGKSADFGWQIIEQQGSENSFAYQEQGDDANFNYATIYQEDQDGSQAFQYQYSDWNFAEIVQLGSSPGVDNYAYQTQDGGSNSAFIQQEGSGNHAEQDQYGDNNWGVFFLEPMDVHGLFYAGAKIIQVGDDNEAFQTQVGVQSAYIKQVGNGHYSVQEQNPYLEDGVGNNRAEAFLYGESNRSGQFQTGFANFAQVKTGEESSDNMAYQYQGVNDISTPFGEESIEFSVPGELSIHNLSYAFQNGSDNGSLQIQFGGFNRSTVQQDGDGNGALSVQYGMTNEAYILQPGDNNIGMIKQFGLCNDGLIYQEGSENFADIMQIGGGNDATIKQFGDSGSGVVSQSGIANSSLILQY